MTDIRQILLFMIMVSCWITTKGQCTTLAFQPGEEIPISYLQAHGDESYFYSIAIPDTIFRFIQGKSYKSECTIPRDSLRYIRCLHYDLNGKVRVGEMIASKRIANSLVEIFRELFRNRYPIQEMRLIDYWNGDDEASMSDNNSSCFNFRFISHTNKVSKHGQGIAVDINPLYNPYYKKLKDGTEVIEPSEGKAYLNRSKDFPYKITKDDLCYKLFILHGFSWGGDWKSCKDYQHFELP